jgi:hypothetical protein
MIYVIRNLSRELNFSVIDLSETFSDEQLGNGMLRDSHHTNPKGASIYADLIWKYLNKNVLKIPLNDFSVEKSLSFPSIKLLDIAAYESANFFIRGEILGIYHKSGPYSNFGEIFLNSKKICRMQLFDIWCYYTRMNYIEPSFFRFAFFKN